MTAPIRAAIIGYGVAGRLFHAPLLASQPEYRLDYLVTADPGRASTARGLYLHTTVLANTAELFERASELDLVVVAAPPGTHFDLASTALDRGLHVVVDKPFVPTSREADALIAHAARVDRRITVFQNRRWDADFLTLRRLVEEGQLGEVHSYESRYEWWKPEGLRGWKATTAVAQGGGILFDLGSHLIDQALQLFGPVARVQGDAVRRIATSESDADDDSVLVLCHRNGTRSTLVMSALAAQPGPRLRVLGSKAAYTTWPLDAQETALAAGASPTDPDFGVLPREAWGDLSTGEERRSVQPERGSYADFYRTLARALNDGTALPVEPQDAVEVLRIIEQANAFRRAVPAHP